MKNTKFANSLVLCYAGLIVGAAEPRAAMLEEILRQPGVTQMLLPCLSTRDIVTLGDVSRAMRETMDPAIEKAAIWESHVLNAAI